MPHMSALSIFDYLSGHGALTTPEVEHLQECGDCRYLTFEIQRSRADAGDLTKLRRFLAEEGRLPSPETAFDIDGDEDEPGLKSGTHD